MAGRGRALVLFTLLVGGPGVLLLLLGLGVELGKWWPLLFTAIGLASFARGLNETGHVVFGFLFTGWSALAIVCLHHVEIGIPHPWLFFLGGFILCFPLAWLLGRLVSTDRK